LFREDIKNIANMKGLNQSRIDKMLLKNTIFAFKYQVIITVDE